LKDAWREGVGERRPAVGGGAGVGGEEPAERANVAEDLRNPFEREAEACTSRIY
jgi:hypothetical protein